MRHYFLIVLFLLMAPLAQAAELPATSQPAANLLPNPGFESGGEQWAIADEVSKVMPDAARSGQMGLRAGGGQDSAIGSSVHSARFAVKPEQEITLRFWARTKDKNSGGAYLLFFKADGKWGKNFACPIKESDGEWHPYELKAKAPADAATVGIWVHSYSGTRSIDLDDFALGGLAPGSVAQAPPPPRRVKTASTEPVNLPARKEPPVIILKFDDLHQVRGKVHPNWTRLTDYLAEKHIKGSIGIICQTLEEATPAYCQWIKERHDSGQIEFWFHAWDHAVHEEQETKYNEFNHRSYEEQKKRFDDSQKLALDKLGFAFATFGPPGGVGSASFDENTFRVMADDPYMKVWLYPGPINEAGKKLEAAGKVTILDRVWAVNLEGAVGVPDFQRFLRGYAKNPNRLYFVLQGHAAQWTPERFKEFTRIIDFLIEQKAVFMTPSEYAAVKRKQN
jgi:peptidoglycan/xylan/chitin deacetylase (PgdA/CDA1 family)